VTVDVPSGAAGRLGSYFASLLRDLGFRARVRETPADIDYSAEVQRPDSRKQMGVNGWFPDYLNASIMLDPLFACPARDDMLLDNLSHICAAKLDAAIERARAAAPEAAPAAWATVDRRVVRVAAAVPYVTPRAPIFVSKRIGNVTSHPTYITLLDQMWVR
jgi:ABC-type transport system substrate-binding protein